MNKTITNLFIFAAGAAIGSVVTWKLVKDRYEQRLQEEIKEVRDYYEEIMCELNGNKPDSSEESTDEVPAETTVAPAFTEQERIDYANLASNYTAEKGGPVTVQMPEVITPGEFGEYGYPTETLTYYADGVLVDDYGDIVDPDDIEGMIGSDFASHFGEYEEDSVFVRNDRLEVDYEILRDYDRYADKPKDYSSQGYE
jgi:hypothetical protein